MRTIYLAALSLMIASPATASTYKDFVKVWDARDATYRAERAALDANAQSAAARAVEALVAADPEASEDLVLALTAAWSLSELVGRGQMLFQLREHMAEKPSAALSEAWLQGKADEIRRRAVDADLIERQIDVLKNRDSTSVKLWIAALERLSMMRGNISGMASELLLIDQNLRSYYRARGEENARSAAIWAAALSAVGSSVRDKQHDIQHRSAVCARTGDCAR